MDTSYSYKNTTTKCDKATFYKFFPDFCPETYMSLNSNLCQDGINEENCIDHYWKNYTNLKLNLNYKTTSPKENWYVFMEGIDLEEHNTMEYMYLYNGLDKFNKIKSADKLLNLIDGSTNLNIVLISTLFEQSHCLYDILRDNKNLDKHKFYVITDDIHYYIEKDKQALFFLTNLASKIFSSYKYLAEEYIEKDKDKIVWFPHYANPDFYLDSFEDYNKKIKKILLSGACTNHYDFRMFLYKLKDDRIDILDHPGWQFKKHKKNIRGNYANIIKKYICCFVDGGTPNNLIKVNKNMCNFRVRRYVVSKIFEVALCQSLLLVDERLVSILRPLGFEEDRHFMSCNFKNYGQKINYILDRKNKNHVLEMINNAYQVVFGNHLLRNRVALIEKNINTSEIIEDFNCDHIRVLPDIKWIANKENLSFKNFACFKDRIAIADGLASHITTLSEFVKETYHDLVLITNNLYWLKKIKLSVPTIIYQAPINWDVIVFINGYNSRQDTYARWDNEHMIVSTHGFAYLVNKQGWLKIRKNIKNLKPGSPLKNLLCKNTNVYMYLF